MNNTAKTYHFKKKNALNKSFVLKNIYMDEL